MDGMISYTPLWKIRYRGTGGTNSARYCYSVWLRHLSMAFQNGINTVPKVIAEIGPGDSLGVGLASLLSGAEKYYALDVVGHTNPDSNLNIFEELVDLFRQRQDIPDDKEFSRVKPLLGSYQFPNHILNDRHLDSCLTAERIRAIRESLLYCRNNSSFNKRSIIRCFSPWYDPGIIQKESVDMIFSQAVLEHVDDLEHTYDSLYHWLKPEGFMSHTIDYKSHGTAKHWNGHWGYPDIIWRLIRGKRPYLLNRMPHSIHLNYQGKTGFQIISDIRIKNNEGIKRQHLAPRFNDISDEDLITSLAYILSTKK